METINLELSKRLTPYLEEVETEYVWYDTIEWEDIFLERKWLYWRDYIYCKTLTLEEAIEFIIKKWFIIWFEEWNIMLLNWVASNELAITEEFYHKDNINWVEKILEYLIDNNLLWKKN